VVAKPFRPWHDLRHTALTHEAAAGNPQAYVQLKAGHWQGAITERYIHAAQVLFPGAAARAEERMFRRRRYSCRGRTGVTSPEMRWLVVAAVFLSLAGASGSSVAASSQPQANLLRGCTPPAKFRGVHAENYRNDCFVCRQFGPRAIAREHHIRSRNPVVIARRHAAKWYRVGYRQAPFEGCLRGFRLRGRP